MLEKLKGRIGLAVLVIINVIYLCYAVFLHVRGELFHNTKVYIFFLVLNFVLIIVESVSLVHRAVIRAVDSRLFAVYSLVISVLAFCIIEIICYSPKPFMSVGIILLNIGILWMVLSGMVVLFANHTAIYIVWMMVCWGFSVVCYFVYQFRELPLSPSDLIAFKTGLEVADGYSYQLNAYFALATDLLIGSVLIILLFPPKRFEKNIIRNVLSGVFVLLVTFFLFDNTDIAKVSGIDVSSWERAKSVKQLGVVASFVEEMQKLTLDKPEGYNTDECRKVLDAHVSYDGNSETPNIIVIMNESFTDLSVLGEFDSDEYLHNYNNIDDYVQKGYLYMSVYGAQTCNSEYEFLTGSSMAFASGNLYMYCDLSHSNSIVEVLKRRGYNTLAYHSGYRPSWNRDIIYKEIGFDEFFAREDMDDIVTVKGQVSDETDYEYLIDLVDNRDKPLFLFNITMQNHGGYDLELIEDYIEPIRMGEGLEQYTNAKTFLTGMRESDKAFYNLLEHFRNSDEKTVVVIFGDHQPALADGFSTMLLPWGGTVEENERFYMTPYMVWANYDMGASQREVDMSANYLSANLLDLLGMKDDYASYLLDLESKLPVINSQGYRTSDGIWHEIGEVNADIENYKKLWYYENFEYRK